MTITTVSAQQVRATVSMPEAIEAVARGFVDLAAGRLEMPPRVVLRDGQFLMMSAHHHPSRSAMVKTLSLNFDREPAISGTVVWSELDRSDTLVADAGAVTTLRTGAVVGVATDLMAAEDASCLVLIGAGAQGADQVRAVNAVRPLRSIRVVDLNTERAEHLVSALRGELDMVDIAVGRDADEAVRQCDILCCATASSVPVFSASSLPAEVHVNAIGAFRPSMRELPEQVLAMSDVVVDQKDAVISESGEIIHALQSGEIVESSLMELGETLTMTPEFGPRTVFKSVGIAVQDWSIAEVLSRKLLGLDPTTR